MTENKSNIKELDSHTWFFSSPSGSALIEFADRNPRKDGVKTWTRNAGDKKQEWVNWYDPDNKFPHECIHMVTSNNILSGIIDTKVEFLVGQKLIVYREEMNEDGSRRRVPVEDEEVNEFLDRSNVYELLHRAAIDDHYFGSHFIEMVFNREKSPKVYSIAHIDASTVRSGEKKPRTGKVSKFYLCPDWSQPKYDNTLSRRQAKKKNNVSSVPAFDKENPQRYPKCILHNKRYMPGHPYYPLPFFWPTAEWIRLASKIPAWHRNGMDNGYNIRYHIEIPKSYIDQIPPGERQTRKDELRTEMDKFMAGKNGMTFFSTYSQSGQLTDGWKITPIENNLNDEAYTAIFSQSNLAVVSGLGIDPTLAGIMVEGKMGNASEKRIAYAIHMALKTPRPRRELVKVLEIVKKINGWPAEIKFGFESIELTTLDENPTGSQSTISD